MKSILVYVDFSTASYNAARYAISLANQLDSPDIILYHTVMPLNQIPSDTDLIITEDSSMPNLTTVDVEEMKNTSEEDLKNLKQNLENQNLTGIEIKTVNDFNTITNGILEAARKYDVEMIIMPVEHVQDKIDEIFIGSNFLDVARESEVPVIIVPADARFKVIHKILFACDLKKVNATTPVNSIKEILDITKAELFVLHIEANASDFKPGITTETIALDNLLGNYNPQYTFAADKNFSEAIDKFALESKIDLIITIPKKYGWFESIFKHSRTKDLAFHTHIPLMTIHAKS